MKYIRLDDKNKVAEILEEYTADLPGIHISKRYSRDVLSSCIIIEENVSVHEGMEYVNGEFKDPITVNFNVSDEKINYSVNTEGLPVFTADDSVNMTLSENNELFYKCETYGNIYFKFLASDGRIYEDILLVGSIPDQYYYPPNTETPQTLEERVTTLEAENESISAVLDALLMGDIEL